MAFGINGFAEQKLLVSSTLKLRSKKNHRKRYATKTSCRAHAPIKVNSIFAENQEKKTAGLSIRNSTYTMHNRSVWNVCLCTFSP